MLRARNGKLPRSLPSPVLLRRAEARLPSPEPSAPASPRPFLDAEDAVQVKYEMIRRHRVDGLSVTEVAAEFGVSRQTFYTLERAFDSGGILALLPSKSGPRAGWKCTPELMEFLERRLDARPDLHMDELIDEVERRFQVKLHPSTLRYALAKSGVVRRGRRGPQCLRRAR